MKINDMDNSKQKKPVEVKNNKTRRLVVKLLLTFLFFIISIMVLTFATNFILAKKTSLEKNINSLKSTNASVLSQIKDIDSKSIAAKNYIKIWENDFTSEQKSLKGLDVGEATKQFQKIALKNKLTNVLINFSPVIEVQGNFNKVSLKTYTTLVNLKFGAITDVNAFQFLDDIKNDLGCFVIIQEVNIKRTKKIDYNFLKSLTSDTIISAVEADVKIRLYALGEK